MPVDRRSDEPVTNDLLAYQVAEMREDLSDFRKETKESLSGFGERLDRDHQQLSARVTGLEGWRESMRGAQREQRRASDGRLSTWQVVGIAASILFGLVGAAIAVLAITVTLLVHFLG